MKGFRPQIFFAILCATVFSVIAIYIGWKMEATEIVTAVIGGIFGFLGGVSLKVLETDNGFLHIQGKIRPKKGNKFSL